MVLGQEIFNRLCRARELLREDCPLTVRQLARETGISPYHFIRQFDALFGLTPHQFRIRSRLERAKRLLLGGNSVTDICLEVGMASLGSFSDLFAKRVGASPSDYRRRAQSLGSEPGCLCLMGSLPATAFRNFQEAPKTTATLECGNADQTHQHHGR